MTEGKRNIIHQLLEEYDIQSAEDIQDALKDLLGGAIKEMMGAEMEGHLGYERSERSDSDDRKSFRLPHFPVWGINLSPKSAILCKIIFLYYTTNLINHIINIFIHH